MKTFINYLSPFNSELDDITVLSVTIILGCFFGAIIYLLIRSFLYKKVFTNSPSEILQHKKIAKVVREYEAGLFEVDGKRKSFISFQKKISQEAVLNQFFNDSVLSSIGNILVGLGVLGTFLGLSIGVSGFEMKDTGTIQKSINSLLGGMGTAFVSSIYGMFFSLVYIFCYQYAKHRIFKRLDAFYVAMDDQYLATEAEIEAYKNKGQIDNIKQVIEEYFVSSTEEERITPKEYFHKLLQASEAQRNSLGNLAEDLALTMQDLMDNLLQSNSEQFKAIIDEKLVPVLQELKAQKEESAGDVIQQVIERLETSMKEMLTDFKDSISGEAKGEMESLAKQLGGLAESLKELPAEIKSVSSNVSDSMSSLTKTVESIIEKVNESQEQSEIKRKAVQDEAADKLSQNMETLSSTVESLTTKMAKSQEESEVQIKAIQNSTAESVKTAVKELTGAVGDVVNQINESQENSEKKRKEVQDEAADKLSENMDALSGTVETLIARMNKSQEESEVQIKAIQDSTAGNVKTAVESLTGAVGDIVNQINESQQANENQIKTIQEQSINNIEQSTGKLTEAVEAAMARINQEQLESDEKRFAIQAEATNKLEKVLTSVQNNLDLFITAQQKGSQKLTDIIEEVDSILGKNNSTLEQFERVLSNAKKMTERLEEGSKSLFEASTNLKDGARAINDSNLAVKGAVTEFVTKNNQSLDKLSNIQEVISVRTKNFLSEFSQFEDGIEKVFNSFNSGLTNYTDELEKSLSETAGKYMDKSSAAIASIGDLTSELNEAIEDLTEVLAKEKSN